MNLNQTGDYPMGALYAHELAQGQAKAAYAARRDQELSGYPTDAVQPQQPLMGEVGQRLSTLKVLAQDAAGDLFTLRDRMFGPIPRNVPGTNSSKNASPGQGAELIEALDAIIEHFASVREEAAFLNSRI